MKPVWKLDCVVYFQYAHNLKHRTLLPAASCFPLIHLFILFFVKPHYSSTQMYVCISLAWLSAL